ncbi:hypothetical protein Ddc_14611 [Ditylenchus destructor]|nr:hypothetical protein Ddc_14611 [Ditylenchus destructor]
MYYVIQCQEYIYISEQCEENETVMGNPVSVIKNLARLAQQKLRYVRETNGADGWEFFKVIYLNFNENILFEFKDANRIVFLLSQLLEKSENLKELIQKSPVKEQLKVFLKETEDHMVTYYQSKRDEPVPHIIALKEALGVLKEKLQVKDEVVQEKGVKKEDV